MIAIQPILTAMMLSLRRRYLERKIDQPFDPTISLDLDAVIVEQERLSERSEREA